MTAIKIFVIGIPVSCVGIAVWWATRKYSELKEELRNTVEEKQLSLFRLLEEKTEASEKEKNSKESNNRLKEELRKTVEEKELLSFQLLEEKKEAAEKEKSSNESCNRLKEDLRKTVDEKELLSLQLIEEKKEAVQKEKSLKELCNRLKEQLTKAVNVSFQLAQEKKVALEKEKSFKELYDKLNEELRNSAKRHSDVVFQLENEILILNDRVEEISRFNRSKPYFNTSRGSSHGKDLGRKIEKEKQKIPGDNELNKDKYSLEHTPTRSSYNEYKQRGNLCNTGRGRNTFNRSRGGG
ncbi:myosin heavy chain, clone 203-like [Artemia franciscana]|uniref:myosin heavy chain, clone 203-like n=1 Tax=Artemia franciscana TaxID=6661 RepID=UPI0032DA4A67